MACMVASGSQPSSDRRRRIAAEQLIGERIDLINRNCIAMPPSRGAHVIAALRFGREALGMTHADGYLVRKSFRQVNF